MAAWLLFVYKVPTEPSRKRTFIWRALNRLHVVYLQRTVCILPETETNVLAFEALVKQVKTFGGEAYLFRVLPKEKSWQSEIESRFGSLWSTRYEKLQEEIRKFIDEIHLEVRRRRYTSEEVEELEEKFETLERWYHKLRRQGGTAKLKTETRARLRSAEIILEKFSRKVEQIEGGRH